jgi:D-alanine--poly(phosphoribitol) ligase subunit 1
MHATDVSVTALIARNIRERPERPALWARGQFLTYGELGQRCAAVRARLARMGLGEAPRLGIVTGDDLGTYVAVVACLLNGSTYVPLPAKAPLARNLDIVRDADLAGILASRAGELTDAAGLPVLLDPLATDEVTLSAEPASPAPSAAAYLLFTSGSTGTPKGVPISHASLNRFMTMMLAEAGYEFSADDRVLQMFELTFDLSVVSLLLPLCVGASCHVVPDSRVGFTATLKVLKEQRITVALMVPSLLAYVEPYLDSLRLPELRLSMFCGEALLDRLVEKWASVVEHRPIHNWYGPTEATVFCLRYVWSAGASPEAAVNGIVPIGRPAGDTSAWLIDESGAAIEATGVKGELVLGGRQLAGGYWRNPEKTAQAFLVSDGSERPSGYKTGDICFRNEEGDFVYCGRADGQVKIDGHRVELGEIEHVVRAATGRAAVAVLAVPEGAGTGLALMLERPEIDGAELMAGLQARLPAYMLPRHVRYFDKLPLNSNGKLDRPKMRALYLERR